jgi:hypothetical protein
MTARVDFAVPFNTLRWCRLGRGTRLHRVSSRAHLERHASPGAAPSSLTIPVGIARSNMRFAVASSWTFSRRIRFEALELGQDALPAAHQVRKGVEPGGVGRDRDRVLCLRVAHGDRDAGHHAALLVLERFDSCQAQILLLRSVEPLWIVHVAARSGSFGPSAEPWVPHFDEAIS